MHCTIKVRMDNDAFSDSPGTELATILREVAEEVEGLHDASQVRHGPWEISLRDSNGNRVGEAVIRK